MASANREHKDRLFKFIFGNPDNKEWTLSLYNAVNGSDYKNADDIELTTIEDVVYMGMKNDVSFLVDNVMNMYEHQSNINPNVPMRFLIYAGMLYGKLVETGGTYHRFSSHLQKAPMPRCVCFYNGTDTVADQSVLRLRDAFVGAGEPDIDVRVTMLNVNFGRNRALLDSCSPLGEYAWFVERVRVGQRDGLVLMEAVDSALDEMPDNMQIKPFLLANRSEVKMMCLTEYDEAKTIAELREEEREVVESQYEALARALHERGRDAELVPALTDKSVRERLFVEFGIEQL